MRQVSIGAQGFEKLRTRNCFYVDKTDFIRQWWETQDDVTLITRPRRFGKTLNMDMLNCFFSNNYADRGDLFENLSIWEHEEYRQIQGTYPVISLSFAPVKETDFEGAKNSIMAMIGNLYGQYEFLLDSDVLSDIKKEEYKKRCYRIDASTVASSLNFLSQLLYEHFGKKVIILFLETVSSFDVANRPSDRLHPERFYHGLVLGLMATERKYEVRSNGESGYGRYDITMVPKRTVRQRGEVLPSFVIEFKLFNPEAPDYEKTLEDTAARALEQIREKAYDTAILSQGIPKEQIRHYGFGFEGKKVFIGTDD